MRIIGGKHGSRKLNFIESDSVRPTADMVRQAMFTKLQFEIDGSSFLDLFAGSGSVGIEAISRNASKVFFVDKDRNCISVIKENLNTIKESAEVFCGDYKDFLTSTKAKFDFIFIDPPYKSGQYNDALKIIKDRNLLYEDGTIICECDNKIPLEQNFFFEVDNRKYGKKRLFFLKNMK